MYACTYVCHICRLKKISDVHETDVNATRLEISSLLVHICTPAADVVLTALLYLRNERDEEN
jgi:hypothetical protein